LTEHIDPAAPGEVAPLVAPNTDLSNQSPDSGNFVFLANDSRRFASKGKGDLFDDAKRVHGGIMLGRAISMGPLIRGEQR